MSSQAAELARRLARDAEAVCRYYLSNGRRAGRYWLVGDVRNTPGRSLFVRLYGPEAGRGAAGRWTDAATFERGDLLDLIALNRGIELRDALDEARAFLRLPRSEPAPGRAHRPAAPAVVPQAARQLFAMSQPITGTLAEMYLRSRGILAWHATDSLRFHPRCYYRPAASSPTEIWPAMIAAVTDLNGRITGAHRTWLDPAGTGKAAIDTPRRAMGHLLGYGVRFGRARDVLAVGEGIETMLSLRMAVPVLPMIAALSANHLAAIQFPPALRRLYIARDADPAGHSATERLITRARGLGIEAIVLSPRLGDFNDDLRLGDSVALSAVMRVALRSDDVARFMP